MSEEIYRNVRQFKRLKIMESNPEIWIFGFIVLAFVIGLIAMLLNKCSHQNYFNSYACSRDDKRFIPTFTVDKIERCFDSDGREIAKYKVINSYFATENNRDFIYQHFYFYDKVGMYNIGDKITFTKQ